MKNIIRLLLLMVLVSLTSSGCTTHAPQPDLLAGFRVSGLERLDSNVAISEDYKDYIRQLSPDERRVAGPVHYYENQSGQHAVLIMIGIDGENWRHILIYDQNDRRIKTVKYMSGHYQS